MTNDLRAGEIAQARLRAGGLSGAEISPLLARAIQLVEGLDMLATLDAVLPEPALIWQPVEEAAP